jgi:hypothetical protein
MKVITSKWMGWTVGVSCMGEMINFVQNYGWDTTQKQTTSLETDMYKRIILKNALRKYGALICTGFKWLRMGCTDGFFKQCEIP